MKKYVLAFLLSTPFLLNAQESTKIQEIGGTTRSLSNFGVTYRIGNTHAVWRFDGLGINLGTNTRRTDYVNQSFGAGLSIGREWRRPLGDRFELRSGFDLGFAYSFFNLEQGSIIQDSEYAQKTIEYRPNFNGVFGFNFLFYEQLVLGFEVQPSVSYGIICRTEYNRSFDQESITTSNREAISIGVNTNSVLLSLSYRFNRSKD